MATKITDIHLSGAASDGASQPDPNLSLGNFRASENLANVVNINQPTNVTGVVINKASVKHNFKPVTGTLTNNNNTVKNAGLDTPTGAATWKPSGGDELKLLLNMGLDAVEDESGKGHVVTHNGGVGTVKGSSPFSEGSSLLLDNVDDFLSIPDNVDFDFNNNDFTIEAFVKISSARGDILSKWGANKSWIFNTISSGELQFAASVDGSANTILMVSTTNVSDNTWRHVAISRSGNDWRMFVDGVQETTTNSATDIFTTTNTLQIGIRTGGSGVDFFHGNITGVEINKGLAKYTTNFTPPTTQKIGKGSTKLLVDMNGANASTTFTDKSQSAHVITTVGNSQVDTSTDPFNTGDGSLLLDGTGDYLSTLDNSDFDFLARDFTLECFVKTNTSQDGQIISKHDETISRSWRINQDLSTGRLEVRLSSNGSVDALALNGTTNIADNLWHHIALTRSDDTWRLFLDGSIEASATSSFTLFNSTQDVRIGAQFLGGNPSQLFTGNIDDVHVLKGVAKYKTAFTPPTKELDINSKQKIQFTAFGDTVREEEHPQLSTDEISRSNTQTSFIRVDTGNGETESVDQNITINNAIGVLNYINATTSLTYTAPGDIVGAAVDVSIDGTYEIVSNDPNLFLEVVVTSASLPGVDKNDNITITKGNNIANLFNNLTLEQGVTGVTDYRCIFIKNNSGVILTNFGVFIEQEGLNLDTSYEIAIERPAIDLNGPVQSIANSTTSPIGLTFGKPNFNNPFNIEQTDLGTGEIYGIWIKRIVPAGSVIIDNNTFQIGLKYTFI